MHACVHPLGLLLCSSLCCLVVLLSHISLSPLSLSLSLSHTQTYTHALSLSLLPYSRIPVFSSVSVTRAFHVIRACCLAIKGKTYQQTKSSNNAPNDDSVLLCMHITIKSGAETTIKKKKKKK
eukprot:Opistho-2@52061